MPHFTAIPHHEILILLIQMAVLLGMARLLGDLAMKVRQPAVVGELLAGILLGPSFLSTFVPVVGEWILPPTPAQGHLLEVVTLMGAIFLLLFTGLEMNVATIRRHTRVAVGTAAGGLILPLVIGLGLGFTLPDFLLVDPANRITFAFFIAAALSISAIPVIVKVLMDLNLLRHEVGQIIIAAGVIDDTVGWILLSIIAGVAAGSAVTVGSVAQAVGSVLLFLLFSFTIGRWGVQRLFTMVQEQGVSSNRILTLVVVLTFAWSAITHGMGLEPILGAFVMGILFSQMPELPRTVIHTLESVALGVFAPLFFAVVGLKVNLLNLATPELLGISLLVIAGATFSKVVGTYVGARLLGKQPHWTALAYGAGLNARGAMGIIVATLGLSLGILTQDMFSIIVLMALATSLMAPTLLRFAMLRAHFSTDSSPQTLPSEVPLG